VCHGKLFSARTERQNLLIPRHDGSVLAEVCYFSAQFHLFAPPYCVKRKYLFVFVRPVALMFILNHKTAHFFTCLLVIELTGDERTLKPWKYYSCRERHLYSLPFKGALMLEEISTSETSVNFYRTTRRNTPENSHVHPLTVQSRNPQNFVQACVARNEERRSQIVDR
jgi:hypothetical protein